MVKAILEVFSEACLKMRRIRFALQDVNVEEGFHAGVPGWNRTSNLLIRSQMLCPIELQVRLG